MDTAIALIEAPLGQAAAAKARHICVRTAGESRPSRHAHERHYVCRRRFDYRERPIGPKLEATKFFLAIGMLIIDLVQVGLFVCGHQLAHLIRDRQAAQSRAHGPSQVQRPRLDTVVPRDKVALRQPCRRITMNVRTPRSVTRTPKPAASVSHTVYRPPGPAGFSA
jgi:hypothetical protein